MTTTKQRTLDADTRRSTGAHDRNRTGDLVLTKDVLYRLSYVSRNLERVVGIEPTSSAWKAEVLPLNYTRPTPKFATSAGGGGRIRTYEGVSRQIYSLLPLAAWVPLRRKTSRLFWEGGAGVSMAKRE